MNNFLKDLQTGKEAEIQFSIIAERQLGATDIKFNTSKNRDELKKWDISYTNQDGKELTFEIKNDVLSEKTGNLAIEFWGRNSASGISTTTADYWVMLSCGQFLIFKTSRLREYIKNNKLRSLQIKNGTAYCYLLPINDAKLITSKILNNGKNIS